MGKKGRPWADNVMEQYERLEAQGAFDVRVDESISLADFKKRRARIPPGYDKPMTVADGLALVGILIDRLHDSKEGFRIPKKR
jgi:hypothetical protein